MTYNEAIKEYGNEVAAALSEEEFNQFFVGHKTKPIFLPYIITEGFGTYEELYIVEEEF